jgi:integrase
VKQNKTGALVDILLEGELLATIRSHMEEHPLIPSFVFTERGRRYTVDGIGSMLRRAVEKAGQANVALAHMRPKGATALYQADTPIRHIQALLGHTTESMTRTYIRQFLPEAVSANNTPILALVRPKS